MQAIGHRNLEIRLAENEWDIEAAQALRYRVFYEELGARPTAEMAARRLDFDEFDRVCDHLLVIDRARSNGRPRVVGTYRLLRRTIARRAGKFYSEDEYDVSGLMSRPEEVLELGRSCIDPDYRGGIVVQLLWRGLATYIREHTIGLIFGCASLPGTDPEALAEALSYLHHYHLAPPALRPRALEQRYVPMARRPKAHMDAATVMSALPPLLKGYLRVGAFVGDGAVVDHQFNTTDVCVVIETSGVAQKYFDYYEREAGRA